VYYEKDATFFAGMFNFFARSGSELPARFDQRYPVYKSGFIERQL
jgi:hypothetical protein